MRTLLLGAAQLLDEGLGGVEVEGPESVSDVEGVDGACAFHVVHGEGELRAWKIK